MAMTYQEQGMDENGDLVLTVHERTIEEMKERLKKLEDDVKHLCAAIEGLKKE